MRAKATVPFENVKECKIMVHIIKGENIPIRNDTFEEFMAYRQRPAALVGGRSTVQ